MSVLSDLTTAREQLAARLVEITASPKPSYTIDGQHVSWHSYQQQLTGQIERLNRLIQQESGPFEHRSQAVT